MMRMLFARAAFALVAAAAAVWTTGAQAATTVTTFDEFTIGGTYGSWGGGQLISGATSYDVVVQSGFGGGFYDLNPLINAAGETTLELDATVNAGPAGFVVSLVDADGTLENYGWFGLPVGNHVLTMPVNAPSWHGGAGTTPGLDLSALDFIHIQVDPGTNTGLYAVSYNNLRLTGVPEPGTCLLAGSSLLGLVALRRRLRG